MANKLTRSHFRTGVNAETGGGTRLRRIPGMKNRDRFVAKTAINGEMRSICGEHLGVRKHLRKPDNGSVAKIHLRIFGRERPDMGNVLGEKRHDPERPCFNHAVKLIDSLLRIAELPDGFGDNGFTGD